MNRLLSLVIGGMLVLASSVVLAESDGSKGAAFLKLGQGARANGMGESFCAVADDINALYWNPAGIAQSKARQITFMYSDWLAGIKYNCLAYVHPEKMLNGIMGVGLTMLDSGDMDKRDINQTSLGTFEGKDMALAVSYAAPLMEKCSLGVTMKYIQMKIAEKKSTGIAFDFGCLYQPQIENLTLSAVVQNLGPELKAFVKEKNELPLNFKIGSAYKLLDDALTLSLDVNFPSDNDTNFNFGVEYWYREILAIRAGYKTLTKDELKSSDLTFGAGFKLPKQGIGIDYAFGNYDELGDTHRVSVLFELGGEMPLTTK